MAFYIGSKGVLVDANLTGKTSGNFSEISSPLGNFWVPAQKAVANLVNTMPLDTPEVSAAKTKAILDAIAAKEQTVPDPTPAP